MGESKEKEFVGFGLFEDDKGNFSSMRIVWMVCMITILAVWAYLSIRKGTIMHLSTGDVMWIAALLGAKLGQKHIEKP